MKISLANIITSGHTFEASEALLRNRFKYLNYILLASFAFQPPALFAIYWAEGLGLTLLEFASFWLVVASFILLRKSKSNYALSVWLYVASPFAISYASLFLTDNDASRTVLPLFSIIVIFFFLGKKAGWMMTLLAYAAIVATLSYDSGLDVRSWIGSSLLIIIVSFIFTFYDDMHAANARELERINAKLESLTVTDKLTQVTNRLGLEQILAQQMQRYGRDGRAFSLMMIDIDYFKAVNDTYGHLVGDDVLIEIASILRATLRATDYVGRWGGEEFMVVLPDTPHHEALLIAEKMRAAVEAFPFRHVGHKTISVGVDTVAPNERIDTLLKRVDDYLYEAKKSGRNRVCSAIEK